ncbi:squalene/phytoene synthase family protein [Tistrella mobilis]
MTTVSDTERAAALTASAEELTRLDPDRFACLMLADPERRADLVALLGFAFETAKTAEVVSETMIGAIRLQWWREALDGIEAGTPRRHQVIDLLAPAIAAHDLPRDRLERMIDAREADFEPTPFADAAAVEAYARDTAGQLARLQARVLGVTDGARLDAAEAVGTGFGLAGVLRALPHQARRRRVLLPRDRMAAAGLGTGQVIEPHLRDQAVTAAIAAMVADLAGRAGGLIADARKAGRLPRPVAGQAALARVHLARLARAGHDPFTAPAVLSPARRAFTLLLARG